MAQVGPACILVLSLQVDSLLEVRPARNIIGSASIFTGAVGPPPITQAGYLPTTFGRYYWAQNEAMNFTVRLRVNDTMVNATGTAPPTSLALQIMENSGGGGSVVASLPSRMLVGGVATWIIPGNLTATLPVGRYLATISPVAAAAAKITVVPHPFAIGRAFEKPLFKINQYGDYGPCWPTPETPPGLDPIFTAPEAVETHLQRSEMMGINMYLIYATSATRDSCSSHQLLERLLTVMCVGWAGTWTGRSNQGRQLRSLRRM
jgi:hypothetical protein